MVAKMFKRNALTVCFVLLGALYVCAKDTNEKIAKNGIYAEYYGIRHDFGSGLFSLNYERVLGKRNITCVRFGVYPDFQSTVSFPMSITWLITPFQNHSIEVGCGLVYRYENFKGKSYHDIPAALFPFMYRFQHKSGFMIRGGVNVFYSWPVLASPSLSIGYRF
jgi:hypothetical protein